MTLRCEVDDGADFMLAKQTLCELRVTDVAVNEYGTVRIQTFDALTVPRIRQRVKHDDSPIGGLE